MIDETQHTDGPWKAQASKMPDNTGGYDWCITDESMAIIAEAFQNIGYAKEERDYPYNQRPVQANANLIAAAPELLEALGCAINRIRILGEIGKVSVEDTITEFETIIAKARKQNDKDK